MSGSDSTLAALVASQFGVFDLADARRCGFTRGVIDARVETGRWVRLFRGVYALGHDRLRREDGGSPRPGRAVRTRC